MNEPFTDEQMQELKEWWNKHYEPGEVHILDSAVVKIHRLIATVESLENDLKLEIQDRVRITKLSEVAFNRLKEENAKLRAEGMYWKHTAANWLPGKNGRQLKLEGWGKNFTGLSGINELRLK